MRSALREIVERVGGQLYDGGARAIVPGPGHSRRDRSLSLSVTPAGRVLYFSHAGDSDRDVFAYLGLDHGSDRPMTSFERRQADRDRQEALRRERERKLSFCRSVWLETIPASGSIVETYLRGRGITLPIPPDVRFHPHCPTGYDRSRFAPCMVALIRDGDGHATGLHVTPLRPDGVGRDTTRPKLMFGVVAGGAARLAPVGGAVLAVAEGLESALSFAQLRGLPTWAALSTSGLTRFEPPAGVDHLIIAADTDDNGAGMKAAHELAERISKQIKITISAPKAGDWNDILRGASL